MMLSKRICLFSFVVLLMATLFLVDVDLGSSEEENSIWDLLIITPFSFLRDSDAIQRLTAHKRAVGIRTFVLTLDSIYWSEGFDGRDEAEEVKKAIAYWKSEMGIQYVMLVGDSDMFPVRYRFREERGAEEYSGTWYPCDLYYADLFDSQGQFCTWDANANGIYGEGFVDYRNQDQMDLHPDVAVGRIPASDVDQLESYVDKVIQYENTAYRSDWFSRALLIANDYPGDDNQNDEIGEILSSIDFEVTKMYSGTATDPDPGSINDYLNDGAGFVNYAGHGDIFCWGGAYGRAGDDPTTLINDLSGLDNAGKLSIILSMCCQTGSFAPRPKWDIYTDEQGNTIQKLSYSEQNRARDHPPDPIQPPDHDRESMAEYWLVRSGLNGAIAFIGATAASSSVSWGLDDGFFEALQGGEATLGDLWTESIEHYLSTHNPWGDRNHLKRFSIFNLFGDPSLKVGGLDYSERTALDFRLRARARISLYCFESVSFNISIEKVYHSQWPHYRLGEPYIVEFELSGLPDDATHSFDPQSLSLLVEGLPTRTNLTITAGDTTGTFVLTVNCTGFYGTSLYPYVVERSFEIRLHIASHEEATETEPAAWIPDPIIPDVICLAYVDVLKGWLEMMMFDGLEWKPFPVPDPPTSPYSPAMTIFQDKLWLVSVGHPTTNPDPIMYRTYDGVDWTGPTPGPNYTIGGTNPAMATLSYKGPLRAYHWVFLFWQTPENGIYGAACEAIDGWSASPFAVTTDPAAVEPTAAIYDQLYVVWVDNDTLLYRTFDGMMWSLPQELIDPQPYPCNPSLTVHDGLLYLAYEVASSPSRIYIQTFDGSVWSEPHELIDPQPTPGLPAICSYKGLIHLIYGSQGDLYCQTYDGETWSTPPIYIPEFNNPFALLTAIIALTLVILVTKRALRKGTSRLKPLMRRI